jgi:hypothetical protein
MIGLSISSGIGLIKTSSGYFVKNNEKIDYA